VDLFLATLATLRRLVIHDLTSLGFSAFVEGGAASFQSTNCDWCTKNGVMERQLQLAASSWMKEPAKE
jgi:hypothetical protein